MSDVGELRIGDIQKKSEAINKSGGINTAGSVFDTKKDSESSDSVFQTPGMTRVEQLTNNGPIMSNRSFTQNSIDLGQKKMPAQKSMQQNAPVQKTQTKKSTGSVKSEEKNGVIRARAELSVFNGEVMQTGVFTHKAKEVSRHFFKQVASWAGDFNNEGFYSQMGIRNVLDCLYVDGMSLRNYVKEQYYYKATGDNAKDQEMLQNYVTLIAARAEHVITLARPKISGREASVEFKNLETDLTELGPESAQKSRGLKERGNHIRTSMKKRMERDLTEQAGIACRNVNGIEMDGYRRIESAKKGLNDAGEDDSAEYQAFKKGFDRYNGGLQKLGLKPDRDDIDRDIAEELLNRCEKAIKAADEFLASNSKNEAAVNAVLKAKAELETDKELLGDAIEKKLTDDEKAMKLTELLDSTIEDKNPSDGRSKDHGNDIGGDDPDPGDGNDTSGEA